MIIGLGTDLVQVARLTRALERFGPRFGARILSAEEQNDWAYAAQSAHFLARRFAAKEAAAKALGSGFRGGMRLQDIWVGHDAQGKPVLNFCQAALRRYDLLGAQGAYLSITDDGDYALAVVVLEN